jgi:hypothetical protein
MLARRDHVKGSCFHTVLPTYYSNTHPFSLRRGKEHNIKPKIFVTSLCLLRQLLCQRRSPVARRPKLWRKMEKGFQSTKTGERRRVIESKAVGPLMNEQYEPDDPVSTIARTGYTTIVYTCVPFFTRLHH